ncbi:uncharacterized protein ATNIH1004_002021 [Aspergillus tanneri]|uniref:Uncharacterized protein n=1 Tax=Aspergillus tanneri TaxID=1220188 RepID=A0A5M9M8V3_9EURO|nr:uncharacterized protein ATNIH1004_002021 [Aspergillus tanneri]KAA8641353.1 hypothetical protein ATNIH1004_002021 [Aspergillus tanneri]
MSLLLVPGLCQRGCGDAIKSTALLAATLASVAYAQAGDNTDVSPTRGDGGPIFTLPTFSDSATPPGGVTLTELLVLPLESPTASGTDSARPARALQVASAALPAQARAQAPQPPSRRRLPVPPTSSASRTSDTSSTTSDGSSRTSSGTSSPSASPSDNAAAGFVDKNWAPWMLAYVAGVGLAL